MKLSIIACLITWGCVSAPASFPEQIVLNSEKFIGKPYLVDPLGEGKTGKYDTDPLFRLDGFDCLTYVETVMALSLHSAKESPEQRLNNIRYKNGEIGYENRNHFMSADWIPNNIKNGFIKDITKSIAQKETQTATAFIQKDTWAKIKKVTGFEGKNTKASVPYLPLTRIFAHPEILKQIPSGAILNIVRPNWDLRKEIGTHLNISHTGFVIHKGNELFFRHASATNKKIEDVDLLTYLKKMANSPTIKGINILQIMLPGKNVDF